MIDRLLLSTVAIICFLSASLLPQPTQALSDCIATGENHTSFHCYTPAKGQFNCEDTDPRCGQWGQQGECSSNPQYMLIYCPKSCESCISGHAGVTQIAPDSSLLPQVIRRMEETRTYLKEQAAFKAKILRTCRNYEPKCTHFAAKGECEKNPSWMHKHCAAACKICK